MRRGIDDVLGRKLGTYFVAGLFAILPISITGYLMVKGFVWADGILGTIVQRFIGRHVPGLGLFLILFLITCLGIIATNFIGRRLIQWLERIVLAIPLVGNIYGTTRQITKAISSPDKAIFRAVVFVEYPRKGLYSPGFRIGEPPAPIPGSDEPWVSVFVPTPPNPATGFIIFLPESQVVYPPMTVEEGFKYVISMGVVHRNNGLDGYNWRDKV